MTERRIRTDRACRLALAASLAAAAALILWLGRDTTYNIDQARFFTAGPELDLEGLFEPQNGNLLLTTTLAYKVLLGSFGAGFLPFRIIHVVVVLINAVLFYALLKRRVGPVPALAPTLVLLGFGSDWGHVGTALGFTVLSSVAAGLGALLLLESPGRIRDACACALLIVSVASFSTGLAFLVGVGVSVMLRPDRWLRAWIWALPFTLYFAWWLWARGADSPSLDPQVWDMLLAPDYAFTSLAAVLASLTGLNYPVPPEIPPTLISLGPGPALAIVAIVLLAVRVARRNVPPTVWVGLGIVLTYWTLSALAAGASFGARDPAKTRYMLPGAVMVLLVAGAAVAGVRLSRRGFVVLFAVAALALVTNLMLLRDGTAWFRNYYSPRAKAQFAMLDLARGRVDPRYDPVYALPDHAVVSTPAGAYLDATARFGSPGFSVGELAEQPEEVRAVADLILVSALAIQLEPSTAPGADFGDCRRIPSAGGAVAVELPSGGASVRMLSAAGGALSVGRFAGLPSAEIGELPPGAPMTLDLPADSSSTRWRVLVATPEPLDICGDFTTVAT